ncbi:MAG: 5-oxoprolinase [Candidatus Tectimicrobiota bacterium]|nr:MAG: 5-oxoprolinase [Candidatus Tectomicrobia bacterium]
MAPCLIAVDVGGTFTDVALADLEGGQLWTTKTPTTPADQAQGFAAGIAKVLQLAGKAASEVVAVVHGSTLATNLILEGKGAPPVLLTTAGCRYVLHIGRHDVPKGANMYLWVKPPRLVRPEHIYEVRERLDPSGAVLQPLDEAACAALLKQLRDLQPPAIAICLLHAYANPVHEQRLRALCQQLCPEVPLSLSSEVLPQFREYERTLVTVLNAYLLPQMGRYYRRLAQQAARLHLRAPLRIMQSNGGMASAEAAAVRPVLTVLSGPAAAAVGATAVARHAGFRHCLSIDVGGTSADVCLAVDAQPTLTTEGALADLPLPFPMLDVHSIGAGGGSLARVTPGGGLQVGPESAGAEPGPACYGRGGREPTVTDAHLVLGRLGETLLGGELRLRRDLAHEAIARGVARPLDLSVEAAAQGILDLANHAMVGAMRALSVERGYDPRDFVLLACGGAGPLHAGRLAELLGIPTVLIPAHAGVLSTLGLLGSDCQRDYVRTVMQRHGRFDLAALEAAWQALEHEARAWLAAEGIPPAAQRLVRFADLRYANQGYELTVPVAAAPLRAETLAQMLEAFHHQHRRLYTYASPDMPVELVNVRLTASGPAWSFTPAPLPAGSGPPPAPAHTRPVYFPALGGWVSCPVYEAATLPPDFQCQGPAILAQPLSTVVVEPGHRVRVDPYGNLIMTIGS